jgi:hypothetical protein
MRAAIQARKKRARPTPRGHAGYGEGMLELGITPLHSGTMFRDVGELNEAVGVLEAAEKGESHRHQYRQCPTMRHPAQPDA